MSVSYRDAEPADAAALDCLFRSSFCDTFAHLYQQRDLDLFLQSFDVADWEAELEDPQYAFRIAEVDGQSAGYIKIGPLKPRIEAKGPALLLDQLYVLTDHHGAGIAQQLMAWALGEAKRRGAAQMFLTVYIENHRARSFYDRYEFEAVGRYDFMVGNHADEDIIMRKFL